MQVQENKLFQMWQVLDSCDSIVLEVEKLQFFHNAKLRAFLQTAPGKEHLAPFRLHMDDYFSFISMA